MALIFAEDAAEVAGTLVHHRKAGFRGLVLFAPADLSAEDLALSADLADIPVVRHDTRNAAALTEAVNAVSAALPEGTWLYYGYNAEYLFYPFAETRLVSEMLAFHADERRAAMLTPVIDLYAGDLTRHPNAVSVGEAYLDKAGYYALSRPDPAADYKPKERQLDMFGGLRWRFEEHIPYGRRKIDRIALFRTKKGLTLRPDFTLSEEEMNTFACPWHHNLTAAVCSFRTAKALATNPASRHAIKGFRWMNSVPFAWNSAQLLDLGLIEPGQWF